MTRIDYQPARDVPEAVLLGHVIQVAEDYLGWRAVHFRPGRTARGWATPVQGSLGVGWPDLVLVRPGRTIAAELKSATGRPTVEQVAVLALLQEAGWETHVWRPQDWPAIVATLGGTLVLP